MEPNFEMNKLSYEIFSVLESNFLFSGSGFSPANSDRGKVRILSIDSGDGLLAAVSLARLESSLRRRSGDPTASIADFFDVAAGSGLGGVLVAAIFTGRSVDQSIRLLSDLRRRRDTWRPFRRSSRSLFGKIFGRSLTLRDTSKPVLIPCYDIATGSPLLFSRADAVETEGYDFRIADVCAATCADQAVEIRSVDKRTGVVAVGAAAAISNPTAAAITHVLNNKREFPLANDVADLMVVSIGSGESECIGRDIGSGTPCRKELVRIAGIGAADMVDQAVGMAFEHCGVSNYVRIQENISKDGDFKKMVATAEPMLTRKNVKSVLFRGKKVFEETNGEKLEWFSGELIKEHERRKMNKISPVVLKQQQQLLMRRSSSATTSTRSTSTGTMSTTSP